MIEYRGVITTKLMRLFFFLMSVALLTVNAERTFLNFDSDLVHGDDKSDQIQEFLNIDYDLKRQVVPSEVLIYTTRDRPQKEMTSKEISEWVRGETKAKAWNQWWLLNMMIYALITLNLHTHLPSLKASYIT